MNSPTVNNKVIGVLGIIFGLFAFSPFVITDGSKLIVPVSDIFFVRYCVVISLINGGVTFLVAGILAFFGLFIPRTEYEKGRNNLLAMLLLSPFFISLLTTVLTQARTLFWKIAGWSALICLLWLVYNNAKKLKKGI